MITVVTEAYVDFNKCDVANPTSLGGLSKRYYRHGIGGGDT